MKRHQFLEVSAAAGLTAATALANQPDEIKVLTKLLNGMLGAHNVPSASFAILQASQLYASVAGQRVAGGAKATTETVYQAASCSKMIAALSGVVLANRGKINIDGNLSKTLQTLNIPSVSGAHAVTLRRLFGMTSGANVHGFGGYPHGHRLPSIMQILHGTPPANSPKIKIVNPPGTHYAYSGGGYEIAQIVLAQATSENYPTLAQSLVLAPLAMTRSSYDVPLGANVAYAYNSSGNVYPGNWNVFPEFAAAGLWTTPTDLIHFAQGLIKSYHGHPISLIGQSWAQQMFQNVDGFRYGIGATLVTRSGVVSYNKGGVNVGYRAYLILFPESGQAAAIMTNGDNGQALFTPFYKAVAQAYNWPYFPGIVD